MLKLHFDFSLKFTMVVEEEKSFYQLEYYSLVSKVCTELTNHLGLDDRNLSEFVIHLARKNPTFEKFKTSLLKKGAEFSDSLIASILRLVQKMFPKKPKKTDTFSSLPGTDVSVLPDQKQTDEKLELRKKLVPALCLPNEDPRKVIWDESQLELHETRKAANVSPSSPSGENHTMTNGLRQTSEKTVSDDLTASAMLKNLEELLSGAKEESMKEHRSSHRKHTKRDQRAKSRSASPFTNEKGRFDGRRRSRDSSVDFSDKHRKRSRSPHRRHSRSPSPHSSSRHHERGYRSPRNRRSPRSRGHHYSRASPVDVPRRGSLERANSEVVTPRVSRSDVPTEPVVGDIYSGRISNILSFGAVVQLDGLRRRWEGLVHISQLRREGRVVNVADVVQRMQKV
ncbi:unnamed protein product, partial [Dicrocoelium dendriticum]